MTLIPDNQQFQPFVPEEEIVCTITKREAILIEKLRKYSYGKITIHKVNGVPVRVVIEDSQMIDPDGVEVNLD